MIYEDLYFVFVDLVLNKSDSSNLICDNIHKYFFVIMECQKCLITQLLCLGW